MTSTGSHTVARLAGLFYLLSLPTAGPGYYLPTTMAGPDPAATLARIEAGRSLFEISIVLGLAGFVDYVLFAALLHRLLSPVGKTAANLMLILAAASVPLALAALAARLDVLALLDGSLFTGDALAAQVALALGRSDSLMTMSVVFWGLWLFPYGWLVYRSGFLPRALGVLIMIGGAAYLYALATKALAPSLLVTAVGGILFLLGVVGGELGTAVWLLVTGGGTSQKRVPAPA